jgi:multiple sugar transport system permease protein
MLERLTRGLAYLATRLGILAVFLFYAFPLFWVFWTSIKPPRLAYQPGAWVFQPTFQGYIDAISAHRMPQLAWNSVVVSTTTTAIALVLGTFAAYALVRFRFGLRRPAFLFFLGARFVPPIALVIPAFLLANFAGILDSRLVLVLMYLVLTVTFTVLMMKGFLQGISVDHEEAAVLDGCTRVGAFLRITLPMLRGGLFATAVFLFMYAWNEFPYALFLTTFRARTLPTAVEYFEGVQGVAWNAAMAYGFLSMLPVLILAMLVRKYMIQGLTFGISRDE